MSVFARKEFTFSDTSSKDSRAIDISFASFTALSANSLFLLDSEINEAPVETAVIPQPIGPANARNAWPAAIPAPSAANPANVLPIHANAAFCATHPDNVLIAVPVEAVPNVVAILIKAVGAIDATPNPAAAPPAIFMPA